MRYDLPKTVEFDGTEHKIRNDCDYRVVLDTIAAMNDKELDEQTRVQCVLFIFYEDLSKITNGQAAVDEMIKIIGCEEELKETKERSARIMDWNHDFKNIAPPISRVLGYSVRDRKNYTHWYDFVGAYMEIGDCYFAQIISIRNKRRKGKKLDESEKNFYKEHREDIDLPIEMSHEEAEWLDGYW